MNVKKIQLYVVAIPVAQIHQEASIVRVTMDTAQQVEVAMTVKVCLLPYSLKSLYVVLEM